MKHEVKQPLRLENGTFMRGEVEVPIEICNAEQIALLQKIERDMRIREKDAKAGKLEDAEYEYGIITCKKCGREYEIENKYAKLVEK